MHSSFLFSKSEAENDCQIISTGTHENRYWYERHDYIRHMFWEKKDFHFNIVVRKIKKKSYRKTPKLSRGLNKGYFWKIG